MVKDFTDFEVWQMASDLVCDVYQLSSRFPGDERYELTSQVRRSTNSIAANLPEASGRFHYKDKVNFLFNARGSLEETRSHLIMAKKCKYSVLPF